MESLTIEWWELAAIVMFIGVVLFFIGAAITPLISIEVEEEFKKEQQQKEKDNDETL